MATWLLYKTDQVGKYWELLASTPRAHFETALNYNGYAKYVFVEALDRNGKALGQSKVIETLVSSPLATQTVANEEEWLAEQNRKSDSWTAKAKSAAGSSTAISSFWILSGILLVVVGRKACQGSRKGIRWWTGKLQS